MHERFSELVKAIAESAPNSEHAAATTHTSAVPLADWEELAPSIREDRPELREPVVENAPAPGCPSNPQHK